MSYYEVYVNKDCRYAGYSLDTAADTFEEYARQARSAGGYVSMLQDGEEIKAVGG